MMYLSTKICSVVLLLGRNPPRSFQSFLSTPFLIRFNSILQKLRKYRCFAVANRGRNFGDNEPRWRRTSGLCFRFRVLVGCIDNVTSEFAVSFRISHRSWPVGRIECLKSAIMSSRVYDHAAERTNLYFSASLSLSTLWRIEEMS